MHILMRQYREKSLIKYYSELLERGKIFLFEPHFKYLKLRYRNLFNIINLD